MEIGFISGNLFGYQKGLHELQDEYFCNHRIVSIKPRTCRSVHLCMEISSSNDTSVESDIDDTLAVSEEQVEMRRNLAIISHADAGKTTLTEKLLLYGGAIQQAGAVRARRSAGTVSDWMSIEKERGISITSTVLSFEYSNKHINILDTPGHQDFSEDTYRTLAAADNVIMLVDAAKGLETQTRKLFEVTQMRKLPTLTFINKLDRPALSPYELCDQIEQEFHIKTTPIVWPIGDGEQFKGVYELSTGLVHLFNRTDRRKKAEENVLHIETDANQVQKEIGDRLFAQLQEDIMILEEMAHPFDREEFLRGDLTPIFFGSAMSTFGVELLLNRFLEMSQAPASRELLDGSIVKPTHEEFTGFVFKLQANMDPKHRDRIAYVRVISGKFTKGMRVNHSRMKNGKQIALSRPQKLFGSDRVVIEDAYPGDVVGLNNPGAFVIGDTLYTGNQRVRFPGIPSFSPELFAYLRNPQPSQRKNFLKGLGQLLEEGAVQMLRARSDEGSEDPILAAVGQLQFEVVQQRLREEYNVESQLEVIPYSIARWVNSWEALDSCGRIFNCFYAKDRWNQPVLLFKNEWNLNSLLEDHPHLQLAPWAFPPSDE
uniref:Tr-type G domain-containing protein n=1 Tax=Timspurckia oligopyrenoides TaxID=708627 RepID=A0A7S0ZL31_9RHOD